MCGFVGFSGRLEDRKEILGRMTDRIIHRGPDMAGDYLDDDIAVGFRRLSIIDLSSAGAQPMTNSLEDSSVVVVCNGEIFNFKEMRAELIEKGHKFASEADTEVLLHGYEEYGETLTDRLRGMFAFVIWDKKQRRLFGARDFFGIKPFYYYKTADGALLFASEIKCFLDHPGFVKRVNEKALLPYMTFQYPVGEETFFKDVYVLPHAHRFSYDIDGGEMKIERYWDVNFNEKHIPFEECRDMLDETIRESVKAHLNADVPVGSFLSGGIDSSYITATLMPDKTFSVGFDVSGTDTTFNETDYAAELSGILGIENYRKMLTADECFEAFPDIIYHMDEPQSNPSCVPLWFLAKLAREQVTVALSGEGADEIYAGYEWYDETPMMRKYKKLPGGLRLALARAAKKLPYFKGHDFIIRSSGHPEEYFIGQAYVYSPKEAKAMLTEGYRNAPSPQEITAPFYARVKGKSELEKKQYLDINLWMPGDILLKADRMSMAHSLELRVPFLDKKVMEFAQTIPHEYKINEINTKYILREASKKVLPREWVERKKKGFPVPIRYWLREDKYYNIVKGYFTAPYAAEFFDTSALMKLLDEHKAGKANNGRKIWTAFTFLTWYKRYFIDIK
ncbi:MAG: asparagine synthase (glutamine-hydrolyzing) [Eubacteriales bacterium]|jgi:asparagine synthase (glutamine-hydrolysing)